MNQFAEGNPNAKIMLVGECWGKDEEKVRKPFQGQAGRVLEGILKECGIPRPRLYITNVLHERPPNNNFQIYYERVGGKKVPTAKLQEAYERLKNEIAQVNPNVIVPMGNEAMKAVLGHAGVMNWRGSVIRNKMGIKVIPTIHPAAILREWVYRSAVVSDFNRISKEGDSHEYKETEREFIIHPTFEESIEEIQRAAGSDYCAFDIETESNEITCIGLSYRPHRAICIPLHRGFKREMWKGEGGFYTDEQECGLIDALRGLLESESPKKIAHNGMFDVEWINRCLHIKTRLHFDTMLAFHTLYSEFPKALSFLTSLYTDHPYYKYQIKTDDQSVYYRYNATDAVLTYECAMALIKELDESGQRNFYDTYVHSLVNPLLSIQHRGVRFDEERRKDLKKRYTKEVTSLQKDLNKKVGYELNINSYPQMTEWLYNELGLPKKVRKRKATGKTTLAADEEALNELYRKHKVEEIKTVLSIREKNKLLSTYLKVKIDKDKRIRCSYNIAGTETGRLSSSSSTHGIGTNLQNVPEDLRVLFLADEGKTLINADLSQAEARIVAHLASEERLIKVFENGGDIHRKNAANIFNKPEGEVTCEERYIAKRVVHASNYGMGAITFAQTAGISTTDSKRLLNQYFSTYPRIRVWHMQIRDTLTRTRCLTTPFGRRRAFFNYWGDSMLKEGLAYVPQSTVADITNQGLINLYNKGCELLLQVHDSIVIQCEEDKVDEYARLMIECMTIPIEINGKIVTIPVEIKSGKNWRDLKLWKKK